MSSDRRCRLVGGGRSHRVVMWRRETRSGTEEMRTPRLTHRTMGKWIFVVTDVSCWRTWIVGLLTVGKRVIPFVLSTVSTLVTHCISTLA